MKKQFKIVFRNESNTYGLWFRDHKGEWVESDTYYTYDDICEEIVELFDTDYSDSAD